MSKQINQNQELNDAFKDLSIDEFKKVVKEPLNINEQDNIKNTSLKNLFISSSKNPEFEQMLKILIDEGLIVDLSFLNNIVKYNDVIKHSNIIKILLHGFYSKCDFQTMTFLNIVEMLPESCHKNLDFNVLFSAFILEKCQHDANKKIKEAFMNGRYSPETKMMWWG